MASVDITSLLAEISPEAPCGEDLSYDPAYTGMESVLTAGLSEGMVGEGGDEDDGPDWRDLRNRCVELFGRTKDLRVCLNLSVALLMAEGLPGFRDGLTALRSLLEQYWETVWPQLDPDDNNDPLERMNIIGALAAPPGGFMDPLMFRKRVHLAPLTQSARIGRFSLQDIEGSQGSAGDETAPDPALIHAAFEDTSTEDLLTLAQAVTESVEAVDAIDQILIEQVGVGQAPNLSGLRDESLAKVHSVLQGHLASRGAADSPVADSTEADPQEGQAATVAEAALSGEVRSPQDVLTALGRIIQYYERYEPSSPVPLLIRRAQRLVSKSFLEIVQDLSPEILDQMHRLGGIDNNPYEA